tara:strand:+ start:567 stop:782 length:216 start_codon:yes stop_codon:yes gene_type:complete
MYFAISNFWEDFGRGLPQARKRKERRERERKRDRGREKRVRGGETRVRGREKRVKCEITGREKRKREEWKY